MATRMIQRRGTAAEWTAANPVLAAGEIGFETDTSKFKFGDGSTAWSSLPYYASIDTLVDGAPELLNTLNELAAAIGDDADFIGTITTDINGKLSLSGGTMTGTLVLAADPVNPPDAATKQYVDSEVSSVNDDLNSFNTTLSGLISTNASAISTLQTNVADNSTSIGLNTTAINNLSTEIDNFKHVFVSSTVPTEDENNPSGAVQEGDLWYDKANGHLYIYVDIAGDSTYAWIESGGSDDIADAALGASNHNFPTAPNNGDIHNGYVYDSTRTAWKVDRTVSLSDNSDVSVSSPAADQVLMYNGTSSVFENVAGVRLDGDGDIPTTYSGKIEASAVTTAVADALVAIRQAVTTDFDDLEKIEAYLTSTLFTDVPALTIKSDTDWATDTSTPLAGSLNVETGGAEIKVKIGNGTDTYANLDYVPTNGSVASDIATAIAPLAPKASPTFSGTVSLPATTSIGDVDATEIGYLNGVTSGIQGQLDSLDTLKAPLASPTFTGTVSGIDKTMVGLSNVDNTSDANKPVSTAQQAALDTKLNLAGGTLTGKLTLDGDPTQALHAVTKQYVDSVEAGLISRPAVKVATTGNLSGTYTNGTAGVDAQLNLGQLATLDIDGITSWSQYDGILVKDQTNKAENGRYVVLQIGNGTDTDWILKRCPLCDEADEIPGSYIFVTDGTTNEQTGWVQHVADPATFTVGTDDINVYQFAGAGAVTAGTNVSVAGNQVSVIDAPVFAGTVDASAAGVAFSDGTQTKAGVPSLTTFTEKTASYTLDTLDHQDNIVEMNMSTAGTFTIPTDAALAWPVGASMDVFATGTGEITIEPVDGTVIVNATPGLKLRTQWSSATLLKRGPNSWVVYGDLKA